ncbi:bifunctional diaminohydroxyphosphoribosylaminopyrimidine deaminase/5-amino-6-(5-phosphoribosylamino)uracil reductase RibD [Arthrobacter sp. BL-252-APC-1A]|uniref:bifunctional diaminohydroxyphosphoribosylaminopyrimidine deaminase/5-amino-6-(5-phosphoribosylamino)uracil reductase RibD n=1 Tax=Arthrobacter sp. BL-252-APC-1A TaxID=2606622 RepID=UPI0012B19939|nr:bifunctional diaminohydroxyphosphoribosylaminopyrimidine deaminase/5-amino-6-(5-phosphoribosylamino)uracil reductase RibD [Arthrobacter sp. BL-252-APC-1A]MSR97401.1 bifunctional diaminohydroxyphosphoribosylaminopyrimidine deaminase/5-amino-6-(5-phosphoribosylamino)uracil reductase RibD [Arthrobacter sp. BL-252-APC-1A]
MAFSDAEHTAMEQALQLACRGVRGANPLVGAVILGPSGDVLATGWHRGAGTPHAEADALASAAAAGTDVRGATMVVTLEPCHHTGRTGPCSQAILRAGLARVVYGAADTNDDAAGGAAALAAAGIDAEGGLLAGASRELNHRWAVATAARRPFLTVKTAQTLDGRTAAADGTSQWITSPEARADAQDLRLRADAILAGTGTVQADDPRLTARNPDGSDAVQQPLRVVMGHTPVPGGARVRGADGRFLHLKTHDPAVVLAELYDRGVRHLMVEGGGTVAGAFLRAGLADELLAYTAPALLGAGTPAFAGLGIVSMAQIQRWRWDQAGGGAAVPVGPDLRLHLEPLPENDLRVRT